MNESIALFERLQGQSVLVLGKGPSLSAESFADAAPGRVVIGINQTSAFFPVDVAFFIDIEPFREISSHLLSQRCAVVLPWRPNQRSWRKSRSWPMSSTLLDQLATDNIIQALDQQGRLYYFHTSTIPTTCGRNVFIPNLVSLSSLLHILAATGVKEVKTLGVDGGSHYSSVLPASALKTQLRNGYSKQFPILRKIAISQGLTMERANEAPVNIYIGCEPEQHLPAKILEHSILRHTNSPVRIHRLNEHKPTSHQSLGGRTPFSMQRFLIPKLNEKKGLAIYLDSDMLVFHDIRELIELRNQSVVVSSAVAPPNSGRQPQFSVMVIDCARAKWDFQEIEQLASQRYESAMLEFDFEPSKQACLPFQWNSLERFDKETRLIHFTDMDRQPWISVANKLAPIWFDALFEALRDDFITFDDLVQNAKRGWIRPGVLWQAEHNERDPVAVPRSIKLRDSLYAPPHTVARFTQRNTPPVRASLAIAKRLVHWVRSAKRI